jgi:glycosyltransferase involved in cell wall biosynthesis
VNDNSDRSELYEPLQEYVFKNFGNLVRIKNLSERKGLIVTRLEGARIATGEVLVFLDSHIEVNINWLPPLLDPIKRHRNISTVPIVDDFHPETFEYTVYGNGHRGVFDWNFIYKDIPRKKDPFESNIRPAATPLMLGCTFAINREYFFELGAYDEGLQIWNGENYELSFKLWLCEGGLGVLEVPCSRVAHNFRKINPSRASKTDFIGRNFKRIAEVWLGEYKEVLYNNEPGRFDKIVDYGDITKQKKIREDLNCKPFKYFLDYVAPDMASRWPPLVHAPVFASGSIRNLEDPELCVDTFGLAMVFETIGLYPCEESRNKTQHFNLNFFKGIATYNYDSCLDSYKIGLTDCNFLPYGNQYWKYDLVGILWY